MAHYELAPGKTSRAVAHRTVEEIWYFISGRGDLWRKRGEQEQVVEVKPGTCLTIPVSTLFQFRSLGAEPLVAIGITMPPWPGSQEAVKGEGIWQPTE